jgi:hypothetical protein
VFALRIGVDLSHESGYIDHYVPTPTGAGPGGTILALGTNDSTGVLGQRGVNDMRTQVFRITGKIAAPDDWTDHAGIHVAAHCRLRHRYLSIPASDSMIRTSASPNPRPTIWCCRA